jgi:23S rRNA pseudouridine1911/1915/1917 synthase
VTTEPADEQRLVVPAAEAGRRLDVFLARQLPARSRSEIQRLIRTGHVTVEAHEIKASTPVTEGLVVRVTLPHPAPAVPEPEALPLSILHEDDDLVVIDKPAGMVVHPAAGHARGTLVNALLHHVRHLSGIGGERRPGIVHRLDRGTSGVMVIAKNDQAHRDLARQFHDRTVTKEYIALVWGTVRQGQRIEWPIGRDSRDRRKVSSRSPTARTAVTTILDVEPLKGVTLVRIGISTGRTHQIRVHLSEAGHAVVGDELYGGVHRRLPAHLAAAGRLTRPFLHASRLEFSHPKDGRRMSSEAALPADLSDVLRVLQTQQGVVFVFHRFGPAGVRSPRQL